MGPKPPDWEQATVEAIGAEGGGVNQHPELRRLADGLYVWAKFSPHFLDGTLRYRVRLELYVDEAGYAQCRGVEVWSEPGEPAITTEILRNLPLGKLRDLAIRHAARQLRNDNGEPVFVKSDAAGAERALDYVRAARPPARRRPRVSDQTLAEVAMVYRNAKRNPTQAVAEHFDKQGKWISKATAARWVAKARATGHLGETRGKGKAGEMPTAGTALERSTL